MNRRYLVTAALLIATATSVSGQSVKSGIEAWQRGDYAGAVAIWRPLADKGDPDAEFDLGQSYRLGRGVATDLAAVKTWFERAANQGHVDAQTTLGLLLFQNNDQAEGVKWLKKAADQGEPRAQLVYGTALVNGDGVIKDPALGYAYVSRSAAAGLQPAEDTLAQLETLIPVAEKKRGAALERQLAKASAAVINKPAKKPAETAVASPVERPVPKPVKPSKPSLPAPTRLTEGAAAAGGWRIQLGAFSQNGAAQALFHRIEGKPAIVGRKAFYIPVGKITRLQVGPFESKAAAQAACSAVGGSCFPVPPK